MLRTNDPTLPFDPEPDSVESRIDARDRDGRARAVDPRFNVALEASAGTGKTRVLVDRYVNLLREGVKPANILAITFTRKAANEMRERILGTVREAARRGEITASRWRELRDSQGDINISTIDAFCLSLLREFPLEADIDPGFSMADETETPRLVDEALDRALRLCRAVAGEDEHVALVLTQLGDRRTRTGLGALLQRRIVAPRLLSTYLARGPDGLTLLSATSSALRALREVFRGMPGGLEQFLDSGPPEPAFLVLARSLRALHSRDLDPPALQAACAHVRDYFLTQQGAPRLRLPYPKTMFSSEGAWRRHRELVVNHAVVVQNVLAGFRRDLNVLVSRGVWRMFGIAETEYRRTLDTHAVLDFSDVLLRALDLLRQMDEFSRSRYRLESRYHHVLVDEFQDTSRAQWELVSLLVQSWGEGAGLAGTGPLAPSIFIVGDHKQSIYGFRDADVGMFREAGRYLEGLRPDRDVRRTISRSFRSVPALLSFVNDVCQDMDKVPERRDAFTYAEEDRFPIEGREGSGEPDPVGLVPGDSAETCAEIAAAEIARLVDGGALIRDRDTGVHRPVRAGDIAILFRTRESHREFEEALDCRGIPAYVYKGLGFFDADEVKDVLALLWYLADPISDLRAAAFLRSRFLRLSDHALEAIAPNVAGTLAFSEAGPWIDCLNQIDADVLRHAQLVTSRWRGLVDRTPPGELLDLILTESAYALELRGPRHVQARENVKKMRALVRRIQNRGYATMGRLVAHLDRLAVADEANATVDAVNAVSLMTVHAAKGLEFPVVFLVNLARGTGSRRDPIRITGDPDGQTASVAVGDFQSDADADEEAKQREETKRLVYVALTRARDRLYLSWVRREQRLQPARGSLAEVLPPSLQAELSAAGTSDLDVVRWRGTSGRMHRFRVCQVEAVESAPVATRATTAPLDDFAELPDSGRTRQRVTSVASDGERQQEVWGTASDRLIGTLVHRLVQRLGFDADSANVKAAALGILRQDERGDLESVPDWLASTASAYEGLSERPDIRELYEAGPVFHEVPFTMSGERGVLRGTIDCLVRTGANRLTILELKTGRRRPEHRVQLEHYVQAAERLFPGCLVDARIVYADEGADPR